MDNIIEICCGSLDDVIAAQKGGADRIELNSALDLGGLTPSIGTVKLAKKICNIPIMCMVRPRTGGFCYTKNEIDCMKADIYNLIKEGADGLVFGVLTDNGLINKKANKELIAFTKETSQNINKTIEIVFHRAIDVVPDWKTALEQIIDLGVNRILTSGQRQTAIKGLDTICEMINHASGRIQILPGCGLNKDNIQQIQKATHNNQFHMSAGKIHFDNSTSNYPKEAITFNAPYNKENSYKITSLSEVKRIKKTLTS